MNTQDKQHRELDRRLTREAEREAAAINKLRGMTARRRGADRQNITTRFRGQSS